MRARLFLNITLALLLVGLSLLAVYQPGQKVALKPHRLSTLEVSRIGRIVIDRSGPDHSPPDRIELIRAGGHWRMQTPLSVAANDAKVRALLRFLDTRSDQGLDAKTLDLKNFGLAEPQVRVVFDDEPFALGDANPLTAKRYILYRDRVYSGTDNIYHDLLAEAASFVSLTLVPDNAEPSRIVLPNYTLQRNGAKWTLTPEIPAATGDAVTGLVEAWRQGQALAVKARSPTPSPEPAGAMVRLEFAETPAIEFLLRTRAPELILERADLNLEYHLFSDSYPRLFEPQLPATAVPGPGSAAAATATP